VSGLQKFGLWFAAAYLVFWMGGNYSFNYTHNCVRSHTEERAINPEGDTENVTVCDFYSANAKRWTIGDPVRAIFTTWITGWADAAILGGIASAIGFSFWRGQRRERERRREWAEYQEYLARSHLDIDPAWRSPDPEDL
jgi:hypothetical protein